MRLRQYLGLTLLLIGPHLLGQELKFIDLTRLKQRVELRYPPALPVEKGLGSGYGGGSVADCGVDARDPRSLTVSIQSVIVRDNDPKRPFQVVFKVLNTGAVPLQLPIGPHLSDLQPEDASATFKYLSLALSVSPIEDRSSIGYVQLYGKVDAPGTLITLNPGEWLRVDASVEFHSNLPRSGTINLVPGYWIHRVTFHAPQPGGFLTDAENICINEKPTPSVLVHRD
jgi:hypothetical protein